MLLLWFIQIAYVAATTISAQPQLLNDPQLQRERLGAESLPVAIGTVIAAWPLLLLLLVCLLRWPQLLLLQIALFATIALRGILLAASAIIGALLSSNWLPVAQPLLAAIDPQSLGAMFFGFYSANRTWRIYRYYKSVVPSQDRKMPLNRQLAVIPVIGLSSVFIAAYCWIHVEAGLEDWHKARAAKTQADLDYYLNTGDTQYAEAKMSDALVAYQKAIPILEKWAAEPTNHQASLCLSIVYSNMGDICVQLNQFDNALNFHKKAVGINQKRVGLNSSDVQTQIDLAVGHYRIGVVEQAMNDHGSAIKSYDKSLSLLKIVEASNRLSPDVAKSVKDLKDAFSELRNALHQSGVKAEDLSP